MSVLSPAFKCNQGNYPVLSFRMFISRIALKPVLHCPFGTSHCIQGVSRLVDITAGDFPGLCDKNVHINMCPIWTVTDLCPIDT